MTILVKTLTKDSTHNGSMQFHLNTGNTLKEFMFANNIITMHSIMNIGWHTIKVYSLIYQHQIPIS